MTDLHHEWLHADGHHGIERHGVARVRAVGHVGHGSSRVVELDAHGHRLLLQATELVTNAVYRVAEKRIRKKEKKRKELKPMRG